MTRLLRNTCLLLLLALLLPVLFLAQGPVTTGQWVADSDLSQARAGACTAILADGRMLVTGGAGSSGPLTSAEFLGSGGTAAPMGMARSEHLCVTLPDGRVLVAGGRTTGNAVTNAAEIYDPSTGVWSSISSALEARAGATATLLNDGRVLIAGGEGSAVPLQTMQIFDPVSGQFSNAAPLSSPRRNHAATRVADGRVVIAGGFNGSAALASIDIYDPATNSVSSAPSMAAPRTGLSATALDNGMVLLAGGSNGAQDLATSELFDPTTGAFAGGPSMGSPRRGHQAYLIPHNNNVLVVGGVSAGQPLASTEQFAWWTNSFTSLGSVSAARSLMTGGAGPTGFVTIAGGSLADGTASPKQDTILLPTVKTDKLDYQPGDTAVITGSGWKANETVGLSITETPDLDNDSPIALTAMADGAGNFSSTLPIDEADLGTKFVLVATGQSSGLSAETTFTDSVSINSVTVGAQSPASVAAGNSATYTVTVNFNGNSSTCIASLSVTTALPAGAIAGFSPGSLSASAPGNHTSTLTITTTAATPPGSYPFTVKAAGDPGCAGMDRTGNGTLVVVGAPDLTAVKTNNVGGSTNYPTGWTWTLTVANSGNAAASFAALNTILTDNLPNASVAYGSVTTTPLGGTTGTINCSISSSNLNCSAGTAVSIPAGGSFTAVFTATPSAAGSFINPRVGGACSVDPGNVVTESNESNNSCGNTVTVNPRSITVKANAVSRVYGDSTPAFSIFLSVGTLAGGDTLASLGTPSFNTDPNPGVGTHAITVSGLTNANYTITYDNTGVLTVTPRPVTVKANAVSRVYGDSTPAFSIFLSVGSFGYTDTLASLGTPSFSTDPNPGVGTHAITVSGLTNANYTITYDNTGVLTVTLRPVTVKANAVSRIYGDSTPAFSIFLSVGTLGYSDTLVSLGTPSFSTDPNPGVGTHAVTVSGLSNANYTITYDNTGVLTVTPRPVTVKANDVSRVYGDSTPAFSIFLSVGSFGYTDTLASLGTPSFSTDSNPGVGTHAITVSGLTNANYTITYDNTGVLTVTPRPVTVKANAVSRVYGDSTPAFSIFLSVGTLGYSDTLASLGAPSFSTDPNPGVGSHAITLSGLTNANYTITYDNTGVLTVTPRPVTVKANAVSRVYGDSTPAFSIFLSVGTFAYSDNAASLGLPSFGTPVNPGVGTYPITVSGLSNANYTITYDNTGVLTVTPRPVTVKANAVSRVYGDSTPAFSIFLSVGTLGYSDTLAALGTPSFGTPVNPGVGTYAITVSGLSNANYTITYDNTGVLTVTPRPVTVKANAVSRVYGDSTPAFSISLTGGTFGYSDTLASLGTPSFSTDPNPGVGTHAVTVSGLSNANYTITYDNTGVLTVTPRPVTVKANAVSRVYGDSTPAFSISLTVGTFGYSDTLPSLGMPSFSTDPNPGVGTHAITVSGLTNANYTITYDNTGVLTVTPRPVTVKANAVSRVYGDSTPAFSIFLSVGTFAYSDNAASLGLPSFGTPVNPGVGTYLITVSGLSNANYTITYDNTGVLTITPRPVTVKANAVSRVYGDSTPAFSIFLSVGTLGYSDTLAALGTPSFGTPANPGVGTYAITVSGLSNANYTITYDNTGVLTVTPRPVTVKANAVSRVYGDSTPAFSMSLTMGAFAYTDTLASLGTPSFSTDPNPGVGTHAVTVSGLSNANYTITYDNTGVLTVTPRPVTVKANAVSRVYGDSTPPFSISLTGGTFGYSDTLASLGTPSFSTDPNPGVGTHAITVSGLTNANYTITYDNTGVLTVTPRPVTVKTNDVSRVYGDSTPAFSIFLSVGTFGYSDNAASLGTPTFGAPANPGVGTYAITVSGLSNANYTITYDNTGVLTVTPRPVTVKANAVSRVYGDSTPAFSIFLSVGTFAYSDNAASLGTPGFGAPVNPAVGTYPITVSGLSNANYTITYDNTGVLTVTPRPVTVKANAVSRVYGDSTPAFSISLTGGTFGYSDTLASLGTPSFSTDPNPGVGTHAVTVSGLSNANYTITYDNTGVLTVTPRPVTVKANAVSRVYGDSTPAFSISLTVGTFGYSDTLPSLGMPSFSTDPNPGVGTHAITVSGLTNANYTITYDNTGVLTVTPRPVTVKANAVSRVYGDSTPAFSIFLSVGTFAYSDNAASLGLPSFGTPVNPGVGTYLITVSGLSNANYTITYDNTGVLTITPRPTITMLTSSLSITVTPVRVDLTATVSSGGPVPVGLVTFTDSLPVPGTVLGTVGLSGTGMATLSTTTLGLGQHVITATFNPSSNFITSSSGSNAAPAVTITGPPTGSLNQVNTPFNFAATFTDAIGNTPNATAVWSFDGVSSVASIVTESSGSGTATKSYAFPAAGVYSVLLTVNDTLGGITMVNTVNTDPDFVVVYDPNGGFVTGGGWIMSLPDADLRLGHGALTGKANFGFVSKYLKGATVPTGDTEFQFKAGDLDFKSTVYEWLVISGAKAQYKGSGTINGTGNYGFQLTVIDGDYNGTKKQDTFRIQIWDHNQGNGMIYDNQAGDPDDADPVTSLGGGSIVIHK